MTTRLRLARAVDQNVDGVGVSGEHGGEGGEVGVVAVEGARVEPGVGCGGECYEGVGEGAR